MRDSRTSASRSWSNCQRKRQSPFKGFLRDAIRADRYVTENMERETRIELATNSLEGCDSTIELLPLCWVLETGPNSFLIVSGCLLQDQSAPGFRAGRPHEIFRIIFSSVLFLSR